MRLPGLPQPDCSGTPAISWEITPLGIGDLQHGRGMLTHSGTRVMVSARAVAGGEVGCARLHRVARTEEQTQGRRVADKLVLLQKGDQAPQDTAPHAGRLFGKLADLAIPEPCLGEFCETRGGEGVTTGACAQQALAGPPSWLPSVAGRCQKLLRLVDSGRGGEI